MSNSPVQRHLRQFSASQAAPSGATDKSNAASYI